MKVLLIEPNIHSYAMLPTISLPSLKGFINTKTRHHAAVLDLVFHKKDWQQIILDTIKQEHPDLIGFTVLSFTYLDALMIARFIKKHTTALIIFGGVHAILSPEDVIHHHEVDMVCIGEGEEPLRELLDRSLHPNDVEGIWYKVKGKVVKNKPRTLARNLDVLGFPDFEDFDLKKYFVINHNHLPIMASRGCPYTCSYCSNLVLKKTLKGQYVRFRSVDHVMEEIGLRIQNYYEKGLRFLYFFDDTFILDKDYIKDFCQQFTKRGYHRKIGWSVNVRANLITDELMKAMKQAGCYQVRMGVESGNEYIRNKVYHRNMTNQQIYDAFSIIHKNDLQLRLYFIVGAPDETVAMMKESLAMAKQSSTDDILFGVLYPLPGTEIQKLCQQEQIIEQSCDDDASFYKVSPVKRTKYVSQPRMARIIKKIKRWQIQEYLIVGLRLHGPLFFLDCLSFLLYYRMKYDFQLSEMLRWNVQKNKLQHLTIQ
jgi:radical SAM superfamily enzyme YgiQ (UPF0313 family)